MRLIDADKFIEYINPGHLISPTELVFSDNDVVEMIRKQPTVELIGRDIDKENKLKSKIRELHDTVMVWHRQALDEYAEQGKEHDSWTAEEIMMKLRGEIYGYSGVIHTMENDIFFDLFHGEGGQ